MNIRRVLAFALIGLGLSASPVGSSPVFSADTAIVQPAPQLHVSPEISEPPSPPVTPSAVPVEPTPVIGPVSREVLVELAGGQAAADLGRGPVLFSLPAGFPPYVVEHDLYGGWERFGTLEAGMVVRMSGLVSGTYTVGQILNVPNTGTTDEFKAFKKKPKVMLQTCITGTDRMIIVGLY